MNRPPPLPPGHSMNQTIALLSRHIHLSRPEDIYFLNTYLDNLKINSHPHTHIAFYEALSLEEVRITCSMLLYRRKYQSRTQIRYIAVRFSILEDTNVLNGLDSYVVFHCIFQGMQKMMLLKVMPANTVVTT